MYRTVFTVVLLACAFIALPAVEGQSITRYVESAPVDIWGTTSAAPGVSLKDLRDYNSSNYFVLSMGPKVSNSLTFVAVGNTTKPTNGSSPSPSASASPSAAPSPVSPKPIQYEATYKFKVGKEVRLEKDDLILNILFNTNQSPADLAWTFHVQGSNSSSPWRQIKEIKGTGGKWVNDTATFPTLSYGPTEFVLVKIMSPQLTTATGYNASLGHLALVIDLPHGPTQTCPSSGSSVCSGHGKCDTTSGECQCDAGYTPPLCLKEAYQPQPGATFQMQLTAMNNSIPDCYDVDVYIIDTLIATRQSIQKIQATQRRAFCYIIFGLHDPRWDGKKRNGGVTIPTVPQAALGQNFTGFNPYDVQMRWLDIKNAALRPRFEFMVDYAFELGCNGVVAGHVDAWRPANTHVSTPSPTPVASTTPTPSPNVTTPTPTPSPPANKTSPSPSTSPKNNGTVMFLQTGARVAQNSSSTSDPKATKVTGFAISGNDQLDFNKYVAKEVRERGKMTVGMANNQEQSAELVGTFNFAVAMNCLSESNCDLSDFSPFTAANLTVFGVETGNGQKSTCDQAQKLGYDFILKGPKLGAEPFTPCHGGQIGTACDKTGPRAGTVQGDLSAHSATVWWTEFEDDYSAIHEYHWGIAAQQKKDPDVVPWRSVGTKRNAQYHDASLRLHSGVEYFVLVRATNRVGMSIIAASSPIETSGGSITIGAGGVNDTFGIKDQFGKSVNITLDIPAGAVAPGTTLDLTAAPAQGGQYADPTADGNSTMKYAGITFAITARSPNGTQSPHLVFNKPIGVNVGLPSKMDGDVDSLVLNYYDTSSKAWVNAACGTPRINLGPNGQTSVPVYICHLTQFGVFYEGTDGTPVDGKSRTWIYVVLGIVGVLIAGIVGYFVCRPKPDRHDDFDQL